MPSMKRESTPYKESTLNYEYNISVHTLRVVENLHFEEVDKEKEIADK